MTDILKGIQYFYECILPRALSSNDWNDNKILNAFSWAKYCEEIYSKCNDDCIKSEVDDLLHSLKNKTENIKFPLCSQGLKDSSFSLYQAFLQNTEISIKDLKNLLNGTKEINFNKAETDVGMLNEMCIDLVNALEPITLVDDPHRSLYYEVKADMYLEYLQNSIAHLCSENQSECFLSSAIEALCGNQEQMNILLHLLLYNCKPSCCEKIQEIQEFIFSYVLLKIINDKQYLFAQFLWKQKPHVWRAVVTKNAAFYSYYTDFLSTSADMLVKEYRDSIPIWRTKSSSANEVVLSYSEVVSHFESLLQPQDNISRVTNDYISAQVIRASSSHSVWNDIVACMPKQ